MASHDAPAASRSISSIAVMFKSLHDILITQSMETKLAITILKSDLPRDGISVGFRLELVESSIEHDVLQNWMLLLLCKLGAVINDSYLTKTSMKKKAIKTM